MVDFFGIVGSDNSDSSIPMICAKPMNFRMPMYICSIPSGYS